MRTLILAFITIALWAASYWAHLYFNLGIEVTAAVVALVGVAAAVVAIYPLRARGRCEVANPYMSLSWLDDKREFISARVEAHVINTSEQLDTLKAVQYLFYRRDGVVGMFDFVFGARQIDTSAGQILPCPLKSGITYLVESRDHCAATSQLGEFIQKGPTKDFTLRCRFVFSNARSVTVRIRPLDEGDKPGRLRGWIMEHIHMLMRGRSYA